MNVPAKFIKRVSENLKRYQDVISNLKKRDANESDTVTAVADVLEAIFGYNKYEELTSEYAIRGTYCDLAIIDSKNKKIKFLVEVKAISSALNDSHVKQAIDYGANAGVSWVILTNAENWIIYKIKFGKPIEKELVAEFNLLSVTLKSENSLMPLFVISKDGQEKSIIDDYYSSIQAKSKYIIGALLNSDEVYSLIRRNMKKLYEDVKITNEEIADIMANDIIKREILDSDESKKAKKDIERILKKIERAKARAEGTLDKQNVENIDNAENKE